MCVLGLTGQSHGRSVLQDVLTQLHHLHAGGGDDVRPGVVRHQHLQVVRPRGSPFPDAELTRGLVQTEGPERRRQEEAGGGGQSGSLLI